MAPTLKEHGVFLGDYYCEKCGRKLRWGHMKDDEAAFHTFCCQTHYIAEPSGYDIKAIPTYYYVYAEKCHGCHWCRQEHDSLYGGSVYGPHYCSIEDDGYKCPFKDTAHRESLAGQKIKLEKR